jgi:hypothetical protein
MLERLELEKRDVDADVLLSVLIADMLDADMLGVSFVD